MVNLNVPTTARTRPIPLRMRDDLLVQRREAGAARYVIKDPIAQTYHQLWEQEFALLRLLDGRRTPEQIKDRFESEFKPARLDLHRLHALYASFYRRGLVLSLSGGQAVSLWSQHLESKRFRFAELLKALLSFRMRGINPNRIFEQMNQWLGWMHHPAWLITSLGFIVITLLSLVINWPFFLARLPALHEYLTADNFFLVILTLIALKLVHEFAHGLACKHSGGECNELGVMFLLLAPCLYCDVSDAWLIENRWRRAWVAAAGLWSELTMAAIATWIWWFTYPGIVNTLCLNIMLLGGLTSLIFNANPLLRYDGYFVLSDLLELPNLWERSRAHLRASLVQFFYGSNSSRADEMPDQKGAGLIIYAVASWLYQWIVLLLVLVVMYRSLEALRLEALGAVLAAALVVVMMVLPASQQIMRVISDPRRLKRLQRGRLLGTLALSMMLALTFCYLPLPCSLHVPCILSPSGIQTVVAPAEGLLQTCLPEGSRVVAGQAIASLHSPMMALDLTGKQGELSRQRAHLQGLEARRGTDPIVPAQITTTQQAIRGLEAEVNSLQLLLERMTVRSPIDGIISACERRPVRKSFAGMTLTLNDYNTIEQESNGTWTGSPLDRENAGCLISPGQPICHVSPQTDVEGHLIVTQTQIDWVAVGQSVTARSALAPDSQLIGRVVEISALPTRKLPTIIAHQQLVAHRPAADGAFEALQPVYQVRVEFNTGDLPCIDQALGRATIHVAPRSLGARVWRALCEALGIPSGL